MTAAGGECFDTSRVSGGLTVNKKPVCSVPTGANVAAEVRKRLVRVTTALQSVTQNYGAFANPRGVYLEVVLAIHELETANWIVSEYSDERQ
jgi:hypothetical protein